MFQQLNIDQSLMDCIHDILVELKNTKPSDTEILKIIHSMPKHILSIGQEWGYKDTVFGDELYVWVRDNNL